MGDIEGGDVAIELPSAALNEISSNLNDSGKENGEIKVLDNSNNIIELKLEEPKRNSIGLKTLTELNGKDNFIIDLESGDIKPKKLTGPQLLFEKFLKTQGKTKHHKDTVCMNILSVENGKLENQKVEVRLDKEVELDHSRPGFSHEKLKENLKNQILQQRLEKLKQRFYKSEQAELEPEDKDHFPHNNIESDNKNVEPKEPDTSDEEWVEGQEEDDCSGSDESENEEVVTQKKKKKGDASKFLDEEAVDEDCENEESSESESESSDEESENEQPVQKKGRILKAFVDSDDEDSKTIVGKNAEKDEIDSVPLSMESNNRNTPDWKNMKESEELFNSQATDFTFNEPSVSEEINVNNDINELFDPQSQINNDDELMDLCSGQFSVAPSSQIILTNNDFKFTQNFPTSATQDDSSDFVTQVPEIREGKEIDNITAPADDSFVMDVPDRIEVTDEQPTPDLQIENEKQQDAEIDNSENSTQPKKNLNKLLESTDDEQDAADPSDSKKKIKRRKKKKDRVKKLGFSDDEENDESNNINTDLLDEESLEEEQESEMEPEVYVDYDSEENEVEVKLTKTDREKAAKGYFENEAELSGEEDWNSADEDEKGMDKYDISDLADDNEFDQAKLREEVGRIHARKQMDQDIKDVKKIQDLLFEDEENDGVGRERKFRWKNQAEGFIIDENACDGNDNLDTAEQDEENEILWRRMRHERETLINEQSQKMADSDTMSTDILLLDQNSQTVTTASTSTLVKRKFHIIKTNSASTFGINAANSEVNKMDSPFLIKSASTKKNKFSHSSFLSRDEQTLTKIASFMSTKDDEVTNLSSHGGNSMSFAPIEKKDDSKKRKSDGSSIPQEINKKRKVENQRFLLDQLK